MGWWGSYYTGNTYQYAKGEKKRLESQGFDVSVKAYGREMWVQKIDEAHKFGVIMVEKRGEELMTKDIGYDMGPYTSTNPPKRMVKRWALATANAYALEDIPGVLNKYEREPEVLSILKKRLEEGD